MSDWLERQFANARRDVSELPTWLRRGAEPPKEHGLNDQSKEEEETIASLRARLLTLEQALRKLTNDVDGVWQAAEPELREAVGNGNYTVVAERIAEGRAALAASRGREPERT